MKLRGPLAKLVNWWRGYPTAVVTEAPPTPKLEWRSAAEVREWQGPTASCYFQVTSSDPRIVAASIRQIKSDMESTIVNPK